MALFLKASRSRNRAGSIFDYFLVSRLTVKLLNKRNQLFFTQKCQQLFKQNVVVKSLLPALLILVAVRVAFYFVVFDCKSG